MENSIQQEKIIQNIEEIREIAKPSGMIEIQIVNFIFLYMHAYYYLILGA